MLPAQAAWDQRVVERPQDSGCDAGSAEDIPKTFRSRSPAVIARPDVSDTSDNSRRASPTL